MFFSALVMVHHTQIISPKTRGEKNEDIFTHMVRLVSKLLDSWCAMTVETNNFPFSPLPKDWLDWSPNPQSTLVPGVDSLTWGLVGSTTTRGLETHVAVRAFSGSPPLQPEAQPVAWAWGGPIATALCHPRRRPFASPPCTAWTASATARSTRAASAATASSRKMASATCSSRTWRRSRSATWPTSSPRAWTSAGAGCWWSSRWCLWSPG